MINFTDTYIKRVKPEEKRIEKFEGGGFGILVYPTGTKSWIYRYKIDNKKDYIIFGHYPAMSLAEARKKFNELREIRRTGANPKLLIQQDLTREKNTVKKLILHWYTHYVEKNRKQPRQIKQQIEADILPLLGEFELEKIQPIDLTQALDTIVQRGAPIHANRILSTLKQVFNYAVSRGSMQFNPAVNIRARDIGGLEKPKERYLSLEEIKTIWHFLDTTQCQMSIQTKSAINIIILTGVRTAEIRLAQWTHFDFGNSLWVVPKKFIDKASGKNTERPQLEAMLDYARDGDIIIIHSMDRLARNLDDLRKLVMQFTDQQIRVEFVKEGLIFTGEDSPMSKLLLSVMGAFAEFERALIKERQMEGIALAKKRGVYKGRKAVLSQEQIDEIKQRVVQGDKKSQIARDFSISRETLYQYLRKQG